MVDACTSTNMFEPRGWIEQEQRTTVASMAASTAPSSATAAFVPSTLTIPTTDPIRRHLPSHEYRQLEMENVDLEKRVCPLYTKTRPTFLDNDTAWILPRVTTVNVSWKNEKLSAAYKKRKKNNVVVVDLVGPSAARGLNSRPMHISTKSRRVQKMVVGGVPREEAFYEHVLRKQEEESRRHADGGRGNYNVHYDDLF